MSHDDGLLSGLGYEAIERADGAFVDRSAALHARTRSGGIQRPRFGQRQSLDWAIIAFRPIVVQVDRN
nr:hypothetical protein [Actinomyces johnsonii]